ncbi:unnamed protein product [Fusarium langsethiae]|nr:unnamed protein product [Fusarium langsethiae]
MSPPHHHYRESDIHASPLKPTITSRTFEANPIGSLSRSPRPSRPWQRDRASVRASPPLLCAALLVARPSPTESLQTCLCHDQMCLTVQAIMGLDPTTKAGAEAVP